MKPDQLIEDLKAADRTLNILAQRATSKFISPKTAEGLDVLQYLIHNIVAQIKDALPLSPKGELFGIQVVLCTTWASSLLQRLIAKRRETIDAESEGRNQEGC